MFGFVKDISLLLVKYDIIIRRFKILYFPDDNLFLKPLKIITNTHIFSCGNKLKL